MRILLTIALLALTAACSAQPDDAAQGGKKKKGGKKKSRTEAVAVPGLTLTGSLANMTESSGLALGPDPGTFYTHGDHGNRAELCQITWDGKLLKRIEVPGAGNEDWESLATDDQGRLYLADVGNNGNDRHDLTIYRFDPRQPTVAAASLRFSYADQTEFPPAEKDARNFDCEAMVWRAGTLYLFTRDRGQRRHCRVYALPDAPGRNVVAKPVGEYALEGEISGADISPDGRQLALIGQERLFLIALPAGGGIVGGQPRRIDLPGARQAEGISFVDNQTLAITTEQGDIYRYAIGK